MSKVSKTKTETELSTTRFAEKILRKRRLSLTKLTSLHQKALTTLS